MRFRTTRPSTPFLNRSFQLRMTLMILALGAVLLAIRVVSRPDFWARWFPEEPAPAVSETPAGDRLAPDEVLIAAADEQPPTDPEAVPDEELPPAPPAAAAAPLGVDLDILANAEDNAVGIRPAEAEAFYYLLDHAAQTPLEELEQAGRTDVSRQTLLAAAERFRGVPVTLSGELKRLLPQQAGRNEYGVTQFFDAWIINQSSANVPWRVVALEIDGALPISESIDESVPVQVTGFFFKLEGYAAQSGLQITPTLVARKITQAPQPPVNPLVEDQADLFPWIFGAFCVLFGLAALAIIRANTGDRRARRQRKDYLESDGDLTDIQGQSAFDAGSELQDLAQQVEGNGDGDPSSAP